MEKKKFNKEEFFEGAKSVAKVTALMGVVAPIAIAGAGLMRGGVAGVIENLAIAKLFTAALTTLGTIGGTIAGTIVQSNLETVYMSKPSGRSHKLGVAAAGLAMSAVLGTITFDAYNELKENHFRLSENISDFDICVKDDFNEVNDKKDLAVFVNPETKSEFKIEQKI